VGGTKLRVLVSAFACDPEQGSEHAIGWEWCTSLGAVAEEVHVITRAIHREPVERHQREVPENVHFHFFDVGGASYRWSGHSRGLRFYYNLWQAQCVRRCRYIAERWNCSVCHHVTFTGVQYPPGVSQIELPFVWAPVGGLNAPLELIRELGLSVRFRESLHRCVINVSQKVGPVRMAAERAALLGRYPGSTVFSEWSDKTFEVAPTSLEFHRALTDHDSGGPQRSIRADKANPLRIVSAARLVWWKGMQLALCAVAQLKARGLHLVYNIVGDGPMAKSLHRLSNSLGLGDSVSFVGWVDRAEVKGLLRDADVLLHPAFREGWGTVVKEAIEVGTPVVCLDWGGPGHIIRYSRAGWAVDPQHAPTRVVAEIADRLEGVATQDYRGLGPCLQQSWSHPQPPSVSVSAAIRVLYSQLRATRFQCRP